MAKLKGQKTGLAETDPLINCPRVVSQLNSSSDHVLVYNKRWYILFVFALLCVGQGIMYNTWAPIQSTARAVYQWEAFMIDLMPALGCIAPCFTIVPLGWMMDVKGTEISYHQALASPARLFNWGDKGVIRTSSLQIKVEMSSSK